MANDTFIKDPSSVLPYKFDFKALTNGTGESDWLGTTETISSKTVTAETGITVDSSTITDTSTSVTVRISGGTANHDYRVTCEIVTSAGNTDQRTMLFKVRDR